MENVRINSVTAQQMREQLSDLLNRAAYLHEPALVTRQGKAVAVLVAVEDWELYLRMKADEQKRGAEAVSQTSQSADLENGRE